MTHPAPTPLIDTDRWPDLARVPDRPVRARIARRLFTHALKDVPVTVVAPNGLALAGAGVPGGGGPVLRVRRPKEFLNRLGSDGLIGFGEAYQTGAWDTETGDELVALLTELASRLEDLVPKPLQRMRSLAAHHMPRDQDGDRHGARHNAHAHYDLSNDMFEAFLDPSMTYSAALFDPVADADGPGDLHAAQLRKIDAMLDAAGVRKGTRLLEIGSGWGGLAIKAAGERGATVLTVTLSEEQQELARRRIAAAGLAGRIEVRLADYREVAEEQPFDAVVSVEMIEAVGRRYLPDYFQAIERNLARGGRVAVQAITMAHHRMLATQDSYSWIHKYVFPGGLIPSIPELDFAAETAGLRLAARRDFGLDYARTLRAWRHRFEENWPKVAGHGFDEVFRRTWRFYLAYCEAGFASGYLGVSQLTYTRP
ncbi:Cyclopropane-fatty-acyl-phospholipid synthase [Catenulispora acidiphila DSM 44928]|uniref:Cyclopropane-fatty-acyl-phospholipid synthase n=1 Tax=Catenulispora acidiphila (strain DSM 44928 / JCM 14897 / NBRC 102108 / NRRL B-24433 / ID139908) TaxID=479433 RepID=C7QHG4_CATAD|nr:cyclopropane-fatty-acyl-phospholipid synthase family protein [Catenulispora acidiphila]ACU69103.1 Cyclopropane-fatty-acyl-phospholipid synthase [Catenulispora acidiphila DSM 44928]